MSRRVSKRPTDREMDILNVLWERGPGTVHEIRRGLREKLGRSGELAYTTVLSMLQLMREKGLVERDATGRRHVYRARRPQQQTKSRLLEHAFDKFNDSLAQFVAQTLIVKKASPEDLREIRRIIDELESGGDPSGH